MKKNVSAIIRLGIKPRNPWPLTVTRMRNELFVLIYGCHTVFDG
jgi:hypothetical protein